MDDFRALLKDGFQLVAGQQDARSNFSSPKMSVRKTVGMARAAAGRAGLKWSDSASPPSAKRQRVDEPENEDKESINLSDMLRDQIKDHV